MSQQQHVDFFRKVQMRSHLLRRWDVAGAAYVPFIGDGDLAALLYRDRLVCGVDLDQERVATAAPRLPDADVRVGDCSSDQFPFPGLWTAPFAIGDFDAYSEPYAAFRGFWGYANKADRLMLFFTDGQRQTMMRGKFGTAGYWIEPSGAVREEEDHELRSAIFNSYFSRHIFPWFEEYVAPWRVVDRFRYLRGWMLYWGAVIER